MPKKSPGRVLPRKKRKVGYERVGKKLRGKLKTAATSLEAAEMRREVSPQKKRRRMRNLKRIAQRRGTTLDKVRNPSGAVKVKEAVGELIEAAKYVGGKVASIPRKMREVAAKTRR
jgi:hypothetical protein